MGGKTERVLVENVLQSISCKYVCLHIHSFLVSTGEEERERESINIVLL